MNRQIPLSEIFKVSYGTKLDLNKMNQVQYHDKNSVSFVSRSSKNLGVVAYVQPIEGIKPLNEGLITVTLGGTYLLSAFVQQYPFYTAQNVAVLIPKNEMTVREKLFYCICIGKNRFRYSAFGREANRTLKNLPVPASVPTWANQMQSIESIRVTEPINKQSLNLEKIKWKWFKYNYLFDIERGRGPRIKNLKMVQHHLLLQLSKTTV